MGKSSISAAEDVPRSPHISNNKHVAVGNEAEVVHPADGQDAEPEHTKADRRTAHLPATSAPMMFETEPA